MKYCARVPAPPHASPTAHRAPSSPRRFRIALASALLLGAALTAILLAAIPPVARPTLPLDADLRGEAFEQALAAALTKIRPPGEEWAIAVDPADINAWLATRLPKWIEHDPSLSALASATTLRIASIDDTLILEDSVRASGAPVLSLPIAPSIEAGRLTLAIGTARVGRLPVPGSGSALASYLREHLDKLASGPAEIRLSDGRRVALRSLACEPGELRLLFATLPAASP